MKNLLLIPLTTLILLSGCKAEENDPKYDTLAEQASAAEAVEAAIEAVEAAREAELTSYELRGSQDHLGNITIEDLENKVIEQGEYIEQMNDKIRELSRQVDRLHYEDWENVTPKIANLVKEMERDTYR